MRLDTRLVFSRWSAGSTSSFSRVRTTVGVPAGLREMGMVVPSVKIMGRRRRCRDSTKNDVGCKSTYDNERLAAFVSAEVDVQIHDTYRV